MKNLKYLFVITFAFAFFMVYMPVNADLAGGRCNDEYCSIKIERVDENDALAIDPEILTLEEGEILYAVSVLPNYNMSTQIIFSIESSLYYDMKDVVVGYVPSNLSGYNYEDMQYTSYNVLSISQYGNDLKADVDNIIGYLIVDEEYADTDFSVELGGDYSSFNFSDVILNGIKYNNDEETVNVDVLFGNFTYNYVVEQSDEETTSGDWEAANSNSDKIVVDASNSMSELYCDFSFVSYSKDVNMMFEIYNPMAGDESFYPGNLNHRMFHIEAGKKETIRASLTGGNEDVAKEILQGDGKIGHISLFITADADQL